MDRNQSKLHSDKYPPAVQQSESKHVIDAHALAAALAIKTFPDVVHVYALHNGAAQIKKRYEAWK